MKPTLLRVQVLVRVAYVNASKAKCSFVAASRS
jgi:hypothetical protein